MSENEIKPVLVDGTIAAHVANEAYGSQYGIDWIWHHDGIGTLYPQSAIDRLTAERDAAVADAARYRWIRLRIGGREAVEDDFKWEYESGECLAQDVDAAIDAARAQERQ